VKIRRRIAQRLGIREEPLLEAQGVAAVLVIGPATAELAIAALAVA